MGLKNILIVEDEFMLSQLYAMALGDMEFQETATDVYSLHTTEARIASYLDEAQRMVREDVYKVVILDHTMDRKQTTERIVPDIFRTSPDCIVYLSSSDPDKQMAAVKGALAEAGMLDRAPQLKQRAKGDMRGFERIVTEIVRDMHVPSPAANGNRLHL